MTGALRRGFRDVARNRVRAALVVGLVAVAVWIFAAMSQAATATIQQAANLQARTATQIEVTPAGAPAGGGGGAAAFAEDVVTRIGRLPGVAGVSPVLRMQFQDNEARAQMGVVTGVVPEGTLSLAAMGGFTGTPEFVAGRDLSGGDAREPVAVVGEVFARQYGVGIGERFQLPARVFRSPGTQTAPPTLEAEVVGIYRTGVVFGDNQVFLPLDAAQEMFDRPGEISSLSVTAASADVVPQVVEALTRALGDRADVIANEPAAERASSSLRAAAANSQLGAAVAAVVGAAVVAFTMAIVARERRTEIGVLKALGASNRDVSWQFVGEAAGIAVAGGLVGLALAAVSGGSVGRFLVTDVASTQGLAPDAATLGWSLALALVFTAVGVMYPVRQAIRLSPADAIRPG